MTKPAKTGYQTGIEAENMAAAYLMFKGYRILEKRFKTPAGEIDLIAKRGNTLVFVEVKKRKTEADAAEAINAKNQARVRDAALLYLQKHPEYNNLDMRFDALIFSGTPWPRHEENAF